MKYYLMGAISNRFGPLSDFSGSGGILAAARVHQLRRAKSRSRCPSATSCRRSGGKPLHPNALVWKFSVGLAGDDRDSGHRGRPSAAAIEAAFQRGASILQEIGASCIRYVVRSSVSAPSGLTAIHLHLRQGVGVGSITSAVMISIFTPAMSTSLTTLLRTTVDRAAVGLVLVSVQRSGSDHLRVLLRRRPCPSSSGPARQRDQYTAFGPSTAVAGIAQMRGDPVGDPRRLTGIADPVRQRGALRELVD